MKNNFEVDYMSLINSTSDTFASNGWSDAYAGFDSNEEEIIMVLIKNHVPIDDIYEYVNDYLQGYEVGEFMNDNIEDIYDEDGMFKYDEYDLGASLDYYYKITNIIEKLVSEGKIKKKRIRS